MPNWYMELRSPILVLQTLVGTAVFGYSLQRKKSFALRMVLSSLSALLVAYLCQHLLFIPRFDTAIALISHALVSLINYLLAFMVVWHCVDEDIWTVLFFSVSGSIASGMGGRIKTLLRLIPQFDVWASHALGVLALDLICYGVLYATLYLVFRRYTGMTEGKGDTRSKAIFSAIVLLFSLAMSWIPQDMETQPLSTILIDNLLSIVMMGMIYIIQFSVMERARMNSHLDTLRELMYQQRSQYDTSRDTAELINEKYHDLKKLLTGFQNVVPQNQLDRLRDSIARYDMQMHTGNSVLDVVLTERMDMCMSRGIELTCNLNNTDFSFVEELDLYALINNALSNAVNAVMQIPEDGARYIVLTARDKGGMVTIHVENPCAGEVRFADGLPQTDGDPAWHGFGMKSMQRTAEKYGGVLSARQENGCFCLDILLLRPEK